LRADAPGSKGHCCLSGIAGMTSQTAVHQEYIQTKVNPTLETLVTQVLMERPENPVPFMIRWLAEQTKAPVSVLDAEEADALRKEIAALQVEVRELETKLGVSGDAASVDADTEEEQGVDDDVGEMPPVPASYTKQRQRASVSAEAYGAWNKPKEFIAPIHAKTEEQRERLLGVLAQSFLFNTLEQANLDVIVGAMVEKAAEAGERIIQQGDDGDVMFVIEQGSIECKKLIDGEEKVVKECGPGDIFGELALLYNCPRAASVEARKDAVMWELDRETFNYIVRDAAMKRREMYVSFLKTVPVLESFGDYDRAQLADALQKEVIPSGACVFKQGDIGERFYLVEDGELVARKTGPDGTTQDVFDYRRGDYFGELALMRDEGRATTVTAKTEAKLLWVDRKTFRVIFGPLETLLKKKASEYT